MKRVGGEIAAKEENPTVVVQNGKQSWWSTLSPGQRKVITNIAIGLGVSIIAAIAIYFGVKIVKNKISNVTENQSLGKDEAATWAKQIKNAFDNNGWWGTDTELLRRTLREIPSQEDFTKVQAAYRKLYKGENLVNTMTSELKQTEYNEMLAIIQSKPEKAKDANKGVVIYDPDGWAKRIHAAVNYQWLGLFWGTDEDAINAVVLELPSQQAYYDTAAAYYHQYGTSMLDDLAGDLDSATMNKYRRMILAKPKQ